MSLAPTIIDELEAAMQPMVRADCPVVHRFTPGLYIREITIPAGVLVTSMEHRFEHPFVISKGKIAVTSDNEGQVIYEAPYCGITKPGTRRALYAMETTVWTTFHPTDETDVEKIGEAILAPHHNPLLPNLDPAQEAWRQSIPKLPPGS